MSITCCFVECTKPPMPGLTKCHSHKNKIKCSIDGCENQVYARYLCVRHGGKKQCNKPGCTEVARGGSYCVEHGGVIVKRYCTEPGCKRQAHARYKCVRHGGGRTCKLQGCDLHARASGYCHRHTTRNECCHASCHNKRHGSLYCKIHQPLLVKSEPMDMDLQHQINTMDNVFVELFDIALHQESETLHHVDPIDHSILSLLCDSLACPKVPTCLSAPKDHTFSISMSSPCCFADCMKPAMLGSVKCISHKNKIKCSIAGCPNQVYARYLCVRHGGKKICQSSGCQNFARGGSYCIEHGGVAVKRYCTELGCHRQAHARHKCVRHGGGRQCKVNDCGLQARSNGICERHSKTHVLEEMMRNQIPRESTEAIEEWIWRLCQSVSPMPFTTTSCIEHTQDLLSVLVFFTLVDKLKMLCSFADCNREVIPGSTKCMTHKNKLKCSFEGCTNQVYARYLCVRHGGKKQCSMPSCQASVSRGSFCPEHGGGSVKRFCSIEGCRSQAHARGKCVRHGGGRECTQKGCSLYARVGGYCRRHATNQCQELQSKNEANTSPEREMEQERSFSLQLSLEAIDAAILNLLCKTLEQQLHPFLNYNTPIDHPTCSFENCHKPVLFGLTKCQSHKNKIKCSIEGCTKQVYARYLCIRHGGRKRCEYDGCHAFAKRFCSEPGCKRQAHARYKCVRHGGGRQCKVNGCDVHARTNGYCRRHSPDKTHCKSPTSVSMQEPVTTDEECSLSSLVDLVMQDHWVQNEFSCVDDIDHSILTHKNKLKCSIDGCQNQVYARYLCVRHGGKKQCNIQGCRAFASGGNSCTEHGGVVVKRFCTEPGFVKRFCIEEGCKRQAHARFRCVRHGGGRCELHARTNGYCHRHSSRSNCMAQGCNKLQQIGCYCRNHNNVLKKAHAEMSIKLELLEIEPATSPAWTMPLDRIDRSILNSLCDSRLILIQILGITRQ
ncbi:hypothetical protein THRCLA_21804 [Thraustotheca clavata]|uniref:WRKY transcription factor 19 n=1 Tax=Thraustotheca clavata TaxID=74557 RepID=A0A1V9ZNT7_9STRA|nr:hypothetical protein THRCLA_21804 [Thraustotheca clavata]